MAYRDRSTGALFELYGWEQGRINREDAAQTQRLLRAELYRRFHRALECLDDAQTDAEALEVYSQFLNGNL